MKKTTLRIVLMALILVLTFSQTALAEPSDSLKAFYACLVDGWTFLNEEGTSAAYGDGFLQAKLEDNAITITQTYDEEKPLTWTFVQEGDWLTAPLGPDEAEGRSTAYLLLNDAISAQGVNVDLFLGYINALKELQSKYLTYDESDGEKKVSVNIAGPYEYDLDAMDGLAITEEYLLEEGWKPLLGEDYEMISLPYGKVNVFGAATKDGMYVTISEYGGLDDLAFRAIVSFVSVLQPKGWENFIAEYTELKDAEGADFIAQVNLDEAGMEDTWMKYQEGYGFANFIIGDNLLEEDEDETNENPLFATIGDAKEAGGENVLMGGTGDRFAVVLEKDGKYLRAVAELDEEAMRLSDAILEAEDLEAAFQAYDDYILTLPVSYVEEFTVQPKDQAELKAWIGKTVGDLEADGYEYMSSGTQGDENRIVFGMASGIYQYEFLVDADFAAYETAQETDDYGDLVITDAWFAGASINAVELRFHADGTVEEPEDPFAFFNEIYAAYQEALEAAGENGEVDYDGLAEALKEKYPDRAEEIDSTLMMYKLFGIIDTIETP